MARHPPEPAAALADRQLVDAVLGGDRDAFRALVEREADTVIAVCRRILTDTAEAEDAAQDAFVVAYRKLGSYRGDGPLGGWLIRIAVREAIHRRRRSHPATPLDAVEPMLPNEPSDDPALTLDVLERDAALHAAIDALPAHLRDAVRMRYLDDLSYEEIAAATGRPASTVRTHLHRGLTHLRRQLASESN